MYALILAGGRGERLRPLTDTIPKPMIAVNGKPLLCYQLAWLKGGGVTDVVFLCGYRWEAIQDYFQDGTGFGVRAQYSVERSPLGRGGALRRGLRHVPGTERAVVALNGDVVTNDDLADLVRFHQRSNNTATLMLTPYPNAYGVVDVDPEGKVRGFTEKGTLPFWINAGIYVLDRSIRDELPTRGDHETTTFPRLAEQGRLSAYFSQAFCKSVDSFKDLREVEEAALQGLLRTEG
ncbi:MAG: nucleotidyltransferase family protein [Chloroflexi bacterium]|nr:nucleotidyltransferase family protein [Chloroflexota bacterium]